MFCQLYNQSFQWPMGLLTRSHRIPPATASIQCLETHNHFPWPVLHQWWGGQNIHGKLGQYHGCWYPGFLHLQWYWLCKINWALSTMAKDFPCPLHLNIKKLHKMLIPGIKNYLLHDESLDPRSWSLWVPEHWEWVLSLTFLIIGNLICVPRTQVVSS